MLFLKVGRCLDAVYWTAWTTEGGGAGRTNKSENCECAIGCNWYDSIFVLWVGDDLFFVGCLVVASRLRNWQHFGMMFGDSTWRDGDIANKLSSVFG